jgi:hypothetical protein
MAEPDVNPEKCDELRGVTDDDEILFGRIWQIAALGLTAVTAIVSGIMIGKQVEIAQQYLAISQGWRAWYNAGFKPLEDEEVEEAYTYSDTVPNYDAAIGRGRGLARFLLRDQARLLKCTTQYQTGLRQALLRDAMIIEAEALNSLSELTWRVERDRVLKLASTYFSRKLNILNRGREMASQYVGYGALAAGIFGDLGAKAGEGTIFFLGYALSKKKTDYGEGHYPGVNRSSRPLNEQKAMLKALMDPRYSRQVKAVIRNQLWGGDIAVDPDYMEE